MRTLLFRRVPAADGVALAANVFLPDGPGPFPAVVTRTPYHRSGHTARGAQLTDQGIAFVVSDTRGKFDSDGYFRPLVDEAADGHAMIDWVANQSWCNGKVGLWGASYLGIVQVPAASGQHEALRCISPSVAPGAFFRDWVRYDGCFALGNLITWILTHSAGRNQPPMPHFNWSDLWSLPTADAIFERIGFEAPALKTWAEHDVYDDYWKSLDQELMHPKITVPGYHVGGWFDHLTRGQFNAFRNIREHGATAAARDDQRLLIGPWGHNNVYTRGESHRNYGEWDFGHEADLAVFEHELAFLKRYLCDIDDGYSNQPRIKIFVMGANRWIGVDDWPVPGTDEQSWNLDSAGSANTLWGDGKLTRESPTHDADDSYLYDPAHPVPTRGGQVYWGNEHLGPIDQRPLLDRHDILVYRSQPLDKPTCVIGDVHLDLTIASDAEDTDFIAKLCVQEPCGRITSLLVGSLRCRYREGFDKRVPLTPGQATPITLHLSQTAYVFPVGSRIVLTVTSSEFPRINPHPNTMAKPLSGEPAQTTRNRVLHGKANPSRLRLPVVEDWED